MDRLEIIKFLFRQADSIRSKSTTMNPLAWLILILISSIFLSFKVDAPIWLSKTLAIFAGFAVLLYFFAYIYFMLTDPEYLRTEKFVLRKKEIEKGYFGDNITGVIDLQKETTKFIEDKAENKSEAK